MTMYTEAQHADSSTKLHFLSSITLHFINTTLQEKISGLEYNLIKKELITQSL
jgi:hypothetical protein